VGPHNTPFCHLCPSEFFNPWYGQNACFPCGSEATQPEEGKDICVCRKPGRMFQPSDGRCPCLPGYQDIGESIGCIQREHKSCKDGATWNQEGLCLTKEQWNDHCAHQVCATPGDARGYDPSLGLCLCWGQHLSGMCGPLCSEGQRHILQLSCPEGIPQISICPEGQPHIEDFYLLDRPSSPRAVGHPCNLGQEQEPVPLYVIKVNEHGFRGLTRPGPELLHLLSLPFTDPRHPDQGLESFLGKSREKHQSSLWSQSLNSTYPGELPGIQNPTVCLQTNDTLAFLVTREHYPEYDLGHFYNTLQQFDWGRFRALAEESQLNEQSPHLFLQQFQLPGVYVFHLSSNWHRKMYLRTLPPGGRCFVDGPFASTTPRHLIQTGIAKIPQPLKKTHWPGILGVIVLLLGLCLLLLIQCHSLSWARKTAPHPIFRTHQQGYNLDVYISPRTGMTSVRRAQSHQQCDVPRVEGGHGGSWEMVDQVDLEWFDTEAFFGILHRQSLTVTAKLSQTKKELKLLYLKLLSEARSLRQLWDAQYCTPASTDQLPGSTQREQQQAAIAAVRATEEESERRGRLAGEYAASLSHQLELLHQDLHAKQDQWASFCSTLMEAQRLLKASISSEPEKCQQTGQSPKRVVPQLDIVLGHLSQVMLQEGHHLKAWGFLGTGTGAELLRPGPQGGADDITVDPVTKLMVPGPNCAMLPASGHARPIPTGYFIHPDTGHVLPEAGHLGYDLLSGTLVPITDSNTGGIRTSDFAVLPYVPYPTCPATGCPPATHLPVLQPRRISQLGGLMTDPITGIEVPVLAVTLHPQTKQWLTLGGTYNNPLTKTLAPLELGAPMEDPVTEGIVPILGVGLDEHTGQVLALGGLRDATGSLLLPGDSFVEPLSGKTVQLQGASWRAGQTLPHMGGPQALLDANVLVAQRQVIMVLQKYQETPGSRAQRLLEASINDMRQALALSLHHILQQAQRSARQLEAACAIEASGSRIGTMCYPGTELWVPALYGMEIPDPEGSGLMVPILGMQQDGNSDNTTPLAGTMEDAGGKGLVPISIGAQYGPVIGAQMNPSAGVVVPVVQVLEALPRRVKDPGLQNLLERELRVRRQYWQRQEQEEQRLAEHLWHLSQELSFNPGLDARLQLKAAEEACTALEACCLQETERRAGTLSTLSIPEWRLLSQADREEREEEVQVTLGMRKVLHGLGQVAEKLRKASVRLQGQEEEVRLQQNRKQSPQPRNRPRKVVQHLSDEFQEMVRERQNILDRALGQLQYRRELSRLQLLHIQIIAIGTPVCLENYPGDRFYGTVTTSLRDLSADCPLLIPFLKSLTAMLVEDQGHRLGLEDPRPGADSAKVNTVWTPPLFSIMKKIYTWTKAHKDITELQEQMYHRPDPKSSLQSHPNTQTMQKEDLVTVQPMHLSAWEFVVYQHGISVLHLLIPQLQAPEITLQIASRLPATGISDNAFHGSFFYEMIQIHSHIQSAENTLFVGRECLASVGSFVLLLIHHLAHIAAGDTHQDSNPCFLRSFYQGLRAYFKEAFSSTLQMAAVSWDSKFDQSLSTILLEEQPTSEKERDLLSKLIDRKHEPCLTRESSEEYIKKNKDLLLFTNMEHFLKSILSAEK
uniref:Predicted gene, 32742 n=1 Tax=Nannospalax galili TaxID=1026970 RepID=A0A8C6RM06_NANGA